MNRLKNQNLNQTTAGLPFGWVFGDEFGRKTQALISTTNRQTIILQLDDIEEIGSTNQCLFRQKTGFQTEYDKTWHDITPVLTKDPNKDHIALGIWATPQQSTIILQWLTKCKTKSEPKRPQLSGRLVGVLVLHSIHQKTVGLASADKDIDKHTGTNTFVGFHYAS